MSYYGSIEAGGTKFVCAIGIFDGVDIGILNGATSGEHFEIIKRVSFPTTFPQETINRVFDFFDQYELLAIGIGSFGPIDINPESPTYGYITKTPKPYWENFAFLEAIKKRYSVPIAWTTDVNAAAFGEHFAGAAKDVDSSVYLTIGTGIGGGAVVNNQILSGYSHPEMGHLILRPHPEDTFAGSCPFHGNCLEGLASGPAIEKRFGIKADQLEKDHVAWEFVAYYIAQALMNYILILSPKKIILGGGVMNQTHLFPMIRNELTKLMGNYLPLPDLENYIVAPVLENNAATIGCFILAKHQMEHEKSNPIKKETKI